MDSDILLETNRAEHQNLFNLLDSIKPSIIRAADTMVHALQNESKIMICGNGGSAADSQHFAAELIGRFEKDRTALPAVALTTDTSILTAIGNDYGYDTVFDKQIMGLGKQGDVLVGISTSGNSSNILKAMQSARELRIHTVGLLGKDGGEIGKICDTAVVVPHEVTARIQEVHIFIIHYWASCIEKTLFP